MKRQLQASIAAIPLVAASAMMANADERRSYDHAGFDFVEVHEGIDVTLVSGEAYKIEAVSNKSSHLDKLKITQRGDRLIIEQKADWSIFGLLSFTDAWNKTLHVTVQTPRLTEAEANSGADLRVKGFKSNQLTLSAASGADVIAEDLKVGSLFLEASSGANLTAAGTCENLNAEASSGADIWATQMKCSVGKIEVSSGADIDVTVTDHLTAEAIAGGTVNVEGTPEFTKIEEVAGGDVVIAR